MEDNKKVHKEFESDLSDLLRKYNARLGVADMGTHWVPDVRVVVKFEAIDNQRYFSQVVLK